MLKFSKRKVINSKANKIFEYFKHFVSFCIGIAYHGLQKDATTLEIPNVKKYEKIFSEIDVIIELIYRLWVACKKKESIYFLKEHLSLNADEEPVLKIYPYAARPDQACEAVELGFDGT